MSWPALLVLLATPVLAGADEEAKDRARFGPMNAMTLPPLSLLAFGGALEYERFLWPQRHLSLAVRAGARQAARGDFAGVGVGGGAEVRVWYAQKLLLKPRAPEGMAGLYVGLSLDLVGSSLRKRGGDPLGGYFALSVSTLAGYRFFAVWGLIGTVYAGLLVKRNWILDGRTAAASVVRPTWGFTIGWAF